MHLALIAAGVQVQVGPQGLIHRYLNYTETSKERYVARTSGQA